MYALTVRLLTTFIVIIMSVWIGSNSSERKGSKKMQFNWVIITLAIVSTGFAIATIGELPKIGHNNTNKNHR